MTKVKPGRDNRRHLYRHAVRALEDLETLTESLKDPGFLWPDEVRKKLHAISHHMRHAVYRSGIEANWWMP